MKDIMKKLLISRFKMMDAVRVVICCLFFVVCDFVNFALCDNSLARGMLN